MPSRKNSRKIGHIADDWCLSLYLLRLASWSPTLLKFWIIYVYQVCFLKCPTQQYEKTPRRSENTLFKFRHCHSMNKAGQSQYGTDGNNDDSGKSRGRKDVKHCIIVIQITEKTHSSGSHQNWWMDEWFGLNEKK